MNCVQAEVTHGSMAMRVERSGIGAPHFSDTHTASAAARVMMQFLAPGDGSRKHLQCQVEAPDLGKSC